MTSPPDPDLQATLDRYREYRRAVDAGDETWEDLTRFFTDDAVFIDPAWGRVEGIEALREFLVESMAGLEDWRFPVDSIACDGDRVFVKWRQIMPGTRDDGSPIQQSGASTLIYAGGGKFRYEEDLLNMVQVLEDLAVSDWRPPDGYRFPPSAPNRDFTIPPR